MLCDKVHFRMRYRLLAGQEPHDALAPGSGHIVAICSIVITSEPYFSCMSTDASEIRFAFRALHDWRLQLASWYR